MELESRDFRKFGWGIGFWDDDGHDGDAADGGLITWKQIGYCGFHRPYGH
jgi:hypothetical protein